MNHLPYSETETLKTELSRLYEKKLIVDELIRSLEKYAAYQTRSARTTVAARSPISDRLPMRTQ